MTVKIAKLFSGNAAAAPPLPPPNTVAIANNSNRYYKQQQQPPQQRQQQPQHYNHYLNDDDDNMSLYSTADSIITTRAHPFNNSQRPLLAAKKHTLTQFMTNKKPQKKGAAAATYYYQQTQQQRQQPTTTQQYLSPFAQQQKRDSARGLHGFNDFDILSQQYNQHLRSPHLGYPYGSPPSPTANSSDFVFDAPNSLPCASNKSVAAAFTVRQHNQRAQQQQQRQHQQQQYATTSIRTTLQQNSDSLHNNSERFMGKSSRFEDDFCCRRNMQFATPTVAAATPHSLSTSRSSVNSGGGPFIFGIPYQEQQQQQQQQHHQQHDGFSHVCRVPAGGGHGDFVDVESHLMEPALSSDSGLSVTGDSGPSLMQSASETSSSSRESNKSNNNSSKNSNSIKLLLRKCKSKTKKKKKQTTKSEEADSIDENAKTGANEKQQTVKCVVVGDGAVGKTNLILSYLENRFITEHIPTASDIYNADVMVNDSPVHLTLCDTAGQDTLDPLRELCYPDSDVFLLCFSVAKPETFHAIKTKWAPKFARTKAALILVGTQADLRKDTNVLNKLQTRTGEKPISYADAWDLATTIGAKYIETSSATQDKVKEVFDTAIWEALRPTTLPPTPSFWKKLFCLA